jgi:hypothetical protein
MLIYPPARRVTAKAAMSHRFLSDVPTSLQPLCNFFEQRREKNANPTQQGK